MLPATINSDIKIRNRPNKALANVNQSDNHPHQAWPQAFILIAAPFTLNDAHFLLDYG